MSYSKTYTKKYKICKNNVVLTKSLLKITIYIGYVKIDVEKTFSTLVLPKSILYSTYNIDFVIRM